MGVGGRRHATRDWQCSRSAANDASLLTAARVAVREILRARSRSVVGRVVYALLVVLRRRARTHVVPRALLAVLLVLCSWWTRAHLVAGALLAVLVDRVERHRVDGLGGRHLVLARHLELASVLCLRKCDVNQRRCKFNSHRRTQEISFMRPQHAFTIVGADCSPGYDWNRLARVQTEIFHVVVGLPDACSGEIVPWLAVKTPIAHHSRSSAVYLTEV